MSLRRFLVVALLALGLVGSLPLYAAEEIVVLTPHWEGILKEFEAAFNAHDKKGVKFRWMDQGGTSNALQFAKTRFAATPGGIGVDLFWGGGVDPHLELAREKLSVPGAVPPAALAGVAAKIGAMPIYDAKAGWYGNTLSGFGIFYNRALVDRFRLPRPSRWTDLTHPRLLGKVAAADPRASGTIHLMFELILQAQGFDKGWATLTRLSANLKGFPESSSRAIQSVVDGETLYGLAIDFYALGEMLKKGSDKLGFVYPGDGRVINPDAFSLLKGAPNAAAAKRFMVFVMSEKGQRLWLTRRGAPGGPKQFDLVRHSVRPQLYGSKDRYRILSNPFAPGATKGLLNYNAPKGSARWGILNDLLGAWLITPHERWAAAARGGKIKGDLLRPPVSETALNKLLPQWENPAFRAKTITQWENTILSRLKKAGL